MDHMSPTPLFPTKTGGSQFFRVHKSISMGITENEAYIYKLLSEH